MSEVAVRPTTLGDSAGVRECLAAVMRERRWLAHVEPFPLPDTAAYIARCLETGTHYVAVDGDRVVGLCDARREAIPVYAHEAVLGMALLEAYRGRGIGERLIRAVLGAARAAGFERVSLTVYAKNTAAQALYRKVGFVVEGTRVRGKKLDGEYDDVLMMAYLFPETAA